MKRAPQIPIAKPASWKRKRLATSITRWKPIALTWRKALWATRSHVASAGGAPARYIWSPRFNLHAHLAFTTHALPGRTDARSATGPPIMWRQSRSHFTSLHMRARPSFPMATRHLVNRRSSDVVIQERIKRAAGHAEIGKLLRAYILSAPARSIRPMNVSSVGLGRIHASAATETATPRKLSRTTSWSRYRTMRLAWRTPAEQLFGSGRMHASAATETATLGQHLCTTSWPRHRTRRLAWRTPAEQLFGPSMPSAAIAFRAPELVWRTQAQSMMTDAIERSISLATSAIAPSGAVHTPPFEQSPAPVGLSPARTLDPALIDRVAEDVIGRVERRIRIERERRGV